MAKIISVSDDVFDVLKRMKGDKSYSVAIRKLIEKEKNKESVLSFFNKGGISESEMKNIKEEWKRWNKKSA